MIQIFRGSSTAIVAHGRRLAAETERALLLDTPEGAPCSWLSMRRLLDQLIDELGAEPVREALVRHRPVASLVLADLASDLTAEERDEREAIRGRLDSHLSHNWLVQRPLLEGWAALLRDLLKVRGFTLVIPSLHRLEPESVASLRALYRLYPADAPHLVLGYDPTVLTPEPDHQGIVRAIPADHIHQIVFGFQSFPEVETRELTESEVGEPPAAEGRGHRHTEVLGEDLEERALAALASSTGPPTETVCDLMVRAVQHAFQSFGFSAALGNGLTLLAREPDLTREQAAEVHNIIGLAAHNRQFRSKGNMALAAFLEHHFLTALSAETRPSVRIALLYRLAVTLGRRQGKLEQALRWADRCLQEIAEATLPPMQAAHQEAWGRNIRAYLLMRLKRVEDAIREGDGAFKVLDGVYAHLAPEEEVETPPEEPADDTAPPRRSRHREWFIELKATHSLVAYNMAFVAKLREDRESTERWLRLSDRIDSDVIGIDRYTGHSWVDLYRELLRLDLALPRALAGLESAQTERDVIQEYRYHVYAGDLHYRLGDPESARRYFQQAQSLLERFELARFLASVEVSRASSCSRAGDTEEARRTLERALEMDINQSLDAQAQLLARLALVAARAGDELGAEERLDQAVDCAVDSGERDTLLHVAAIAGTVFQLLGRSEEALEAFSQGLEISEVRGAQEDPPPPSAADLCTVLLGLLELGKSDTRSLLRLLALLPEALEDPDAWWQISRILAVVRDAVAQQPEVFRAPELSDSLSVLLRVAAQRSDCAVGLEALQRVLPEPGLARAG